MWLFFLYDPVQIRYENVYPKSNSWLCPCPLPLPYFPFPFLPFSSPLEVDPCTQLGVLGSAVTSPSRSGQSPAAKRYLVDFGLQKCFW